MGRRLTREEALEYALITAGFEIREEEVVYMNGDIGPISVVPRDAMLLFTRARSALRHERFELQKLRDAIETRTK